MQKVNSDFFLNRELTWIEFNKRVLEEAADKSEPLLERLKFLSIFSTNLDEFFMIRVAGLKRQVRNNVNELTTDGMNAREQRNEIYKTLVPLVDEQYRIFNEEIVPQLKVNDVEFVTYSELTEDDKMIVNSYFEDELFPILTPLAIDNVHPFPNLINRSLALAIILEVTEL